MNSDLGFGLIHKEVIECLIIKSLVAKHTNEQRCLGGLVG